MQQLPEAMPAHVAQAFDDYYEMGSDRSLRGLHALYMARVGDDPEPPCRRLNTLGEWSKRYGCSTEQLRAAVTAVGNVAADVEKHLKPVGNAEGDCAALREAFEGLTPREPSSSPE